MHTRYTPKQVADVLQVSTTTLRRYEDQRLLPDIPRTESGRRIYLPIHLQALTTLRSLLRGYDIPVAYEAMRHMKEHRLSEACWLLNRQMHLLQLEKQRTEEVMQLIRQTDFPEILGIKGTSSLSVGEAAALAGVNPSAIRHWEAEGLIVSERNPANGYRMYSVKQLRKIFVIVSLRKTVFFIDRMKVLLDELDSRHFSEVERSFELALHNLDRLLILQMEGAAELVKYANIIKETAPQPQKNG